MPTTLPAAAQQRPGNWLGAASGILTVVLELTGLVVGLAGGRPALTLGATREEITRGYAKPATAAVWVGAYLEVLALLCFIVFAAWLCQRLRRVEGDGGWRSTAAFGAAMAYAVVAMASLAYVDVAELRAGHGLDAQVAIALQDLAGGFYVITWGLAGLFLVAVAAVSLAHHVLPRWLGWATAVLGVASVASMAAPTNDLAQLPPVLLLLWILAASIALLRRREPAGASVRAPAVASS